jgi:hypothetical protein
MLPLDYKAVPSYTDDRTGWNQKWETNLSDIYGSNIIIKLSEQDLGRYMNEIPVSAPNADFVQQMTDQRDRLCILQRNLTLKAATRFTADEFETAWIEKSDDVREKWILEGLVRTCERDSQIEAFRQWAPETALERLQSQGGSGFLRLMKALLIPDPRPGFIPNNFKNLPNEVFDVMVGNIASGTPGSDEKGQRRLTDAIRLSYNIARTIFLTTFCWQIILAFVRPIFYTSNSMQSEF